MVKRMSVKELQTELGSRQLPPLTSERTLSVHI
jgi:chromosome segregation ATPase